MTTWETNVTEVVWESQTAPGITWTTVVGGTVTGGSGPFEETVDNDDNPVILSTVDEAPFVVHPRGYSSSGDGPFHREGLLDPLTDGVDGQEIGDTYSNEAGTYRRTGSGDTDYEMVGAGGGAAVHKIDAFGFTGNNEPMASGGLTVYSSFAPGYPTLTLTVAEGSKVLMLNVSNGSCSLWTAHAAAPWEAASMTGWAAQDELQTRIPAMRGRLISANYGGGPILVPEWDQSLLISQSIDLATDPVDDITRPPAMPPGSLALHSTGLFAERWVSVDGDGDPQVPIPATENIEIIVHGIPRRLPDISPRPSFGEWATYNAPEDDAGADAQELATKYTELDGSNQETDVPGRLLMFWEWMWAGESIEDPHRMHVDIGMRQDFPSYFRLWMDATTGYMSISVLANEGVDLIEAQGRLWKVIADQTVPPAGRVLHNPNSPLWLMTSCPGDAYTIERWHDGTKVCDIDASLLDEAAQDFVDQVGQRWISEDGSVEPVSGVSGYQPLDADLTAIAALAPADGRFMRRLAGAWNTSTPSEVKADLSIGHADVSGFDEQARDVLGAALTAGTGITITLNDGANTITVAMADAATVLAALGVGWRKVDLQSAASAQANLSANLGVAGALKYRIHWRARSTANAVSATVGLRINSSSASDYTMAGSALATSGYFGLMAGSQTNSDRWGAGVLEITPGPVAANAWSLLQGLESRVNSTATVTSTNSPIHGAWRDSVGAGMSTIQMIPSAGNLDVGSYMYVEVLL